MGRPHSPDFTHESVRTYILLNSTPEPNSGCWLWDRWLNANGYGGVTSRRFRGRGGLAHRWSFEAFTGISPGEKDVCHKCDTPACVNPDHLWLGDAKTNAQDMAKKGRNWVRLIGSGPYSKSKYYTKTKNGWISQVKYMGKHQYLGFFKSKEAANEAGVKFWQEKLNQNKT